MLTYDHVTLTSLTTSVVGSELVAFLGTNIGVLRKVKDSLRHDQFQLSLQIIRVMVELSKKIMIFVDIFLNKYTI